MRSFVLVPLLVLSFAGLSLSRLPSCPRMLGAAQREGRTFYSNLPESEAQLSFSDNINEHTCIKRIARRYFQLVSYFACEEGTTAQLLSDGSSPVSSQGPVVDLEERVLLRCVLETDEREADPTSPTEEPERPEPEDTACPTSGPTSASHFRSSERRRGKLCERECTFRTSVYGAIRVRTRRIVTCCEGEPRPFGTTRPLLYECP